MLLDRIAERVRKHQDMQSEVEADRGHQPGFPDFEILYRPGEIKLQVITQHNGAEANTIAIQPGVKEVLQLCLEGSASDDLVRSEEHTSELQSRENLVCRLLLEKK